MRDAPRTPAATTSKDEELYASQRSRVALPLAADERLLSALLGGAFLIVAVVLLPAFGDGGPRWGLWPVYLLALAAQFGADLASTALREWRAVASWPRRLLTAAGIAYGVDAALAPLGLLAAFASVRMHYAFL